jgi:hypothetical protein
MTAADKLADGLIEITANLARYVEEQAQLIARPKIAAAEQAFVKRAAHMQAGFDQREQRSGELIGELRRRVASLERQQERSHLRDVRVRAVADDLDVRDLREAATAVRNALNFVGNMGMPEVRS